MIFSRTHVSQKMKSKYLKSKDKILRNYSNFLIQELNENQEENCEINIARGPIKMPIRKKIRKSLKESNDYELKTYP